VTSARRPWWPEVLLAAGFAVLTWALMVGAGPLLDLDVAVRGWVDSHRPHAAGLVALTGNYLGQGGVLAMLCGGLALVLVWRRHTVRPLLPVATAFLLTVATLQPLKSLTARPAPHALRHHAERLGTGGQSYPSGHLVNALVWYGVLALLLAPWLTPAVRRLVRLVPPAVLTVTTVYLGFHWVTDTAAGLMLGFLLDRLLHRVPWDSVPLGRRLHGWDGPGLPGRPGTGPHHPHELKVPRQLDQVRSQPGT
jgi:membrane-associated phospholipid phosphatase